MASGVWRKAEPVRNEAVGKYAVGNEAIRNEAVGNYAVGNEAIRNEAVGNYAVGNEAMRDTKLFATRLWGLLGYRGRLGMILASRMVAITLRNR